MNNTLAYFAPQPITKITKFYNIVFRFVPKNIFLSMMSLWQVQPLVCSKLMNYENAKRKTQNAKCKTQNAKRKTQNAKRTIFSVAGFVVVSAAVSTLHLQWTRRHHERISPKKRGPTRQQHGAGKDITPDPDCRVHHLFVPLFYFTHIIIKRWFLV
jgi:hypothetical protein